MTNFEYLNITKSDQITIVTINRPGKLNALSLPLLTELEQAFTDLSKDNDLRGVILTGQGKKAFVAGADIEELAHFDVQDARIGSEMGQRVFSQIESFPRPVLAAINGYALGGGCELALACHLRIASTNAQFGFPEVSLGIIPGFGGTVRLPRVIGLGRSIEMVLTGDMISADKAEYLGLVNAVVDITDLLSESINFLKRITRHAPLAVQKAVESLYFSYDARTIEGLNMENDLFGQLVGTQDMKEGINAFLEKRKPVFKGE